jgi:hypothetical protein
MVRVYDIVNGRPVRDLGNLDGLSAQHSKRTVERHLGQIRTDPVGRACEALQLENALDTRLRDLRQEARRENTRDFAGIVSPLHEAVTERFAPDIVAELERAALAKLAGREGRSAERRAAKGGA